jgi:hypothetical protein
MAFHRDKSINLHKQFGELFDYLSNWTSPVRDFEWEVKIDAEFKDYQLDFIEKFPDITEVLPTGRYTRNIPLTGLYLIYFLEKLGIGIPGESVVVDLGARDWNPTSNIRYLCKKNNYNAILIEINTHEQLKAELMAEGIMDRVYLSTDPVRWKGAKPKIHLKYKDISWQDRSVFDKEGILLDEILLRSGMDLNSIICLDFDIDGGEHIIWEQSEILREVRPPVVSMESNVWDKLGQRTLDIKSGTVNYMSSIDIAKSMQYTPVMVVSENILYVADEYLSGSGIEVFPPEELYDYNMIGYIAMKQVRIQYKSLQGNMGEV